MPLFVAAGVKAPDFAGLRVDTIALARCFSHVIPSLSRDLNTHNNRRHLHPGTMTALRQSPELARLSFTIVE